MVNTGAGEDKAWEFLAAADPTALAERAAVGFDRAAGCYRLLSFGRTFLIRPGDRRIFSCEPEGEDFLERDAHFFRLAALWYLIKACPARPSGKLVRPADLPGGDIFLRGTHVLPLDGLAATFATSPTSFLEAGAALGGRETEYGDAALVLSPLPKVPTTVILRTEDDEFPARADLLFDATAPLHLPTDILWSIAMLTVQRLMGHEAFGEP